MKNINKIADYFIFLSDPDIGDSMTNLKLQKLLYYAQSFHLVLFGEPLFEDEIKNWEHGPVVPNIYQQYKDFGGDTIPIPNEVDLDALNQNEKELLKDVYNVYGQFSAWKLRDMTHAEDPWKNTNRNDVISKDSLMTYFKDKVND